MYTYVYPATRIILCQIAKYFSETKCKTHTIKLIWWVSDVVHLRNVSLVNVYVDLHFR